MKFPSLRTLALALTLTAPVMLGVVSAGAQTIINSLPYTINAAGLYVLNNNLSGPQISGNLIDVRASNVTIDFQGHYIAGPAGTQNQSPSPFFGVGAYERSNVTIRNGTIAYCSTGIAIDGNRSATTNSVNIQIENMRVTYCNSTGIEVSSSPGTRIANCQISQVGNNNTLGTFAMNISGTGVVIQNNVISTVIGPGSYGISAATGCFVRQNTISDSVVGVQGGKYQDNLTSGCTYPFYGNGIDAGGNN